MTCLIPRSLQTVCVMLALVSASACGGAQERKALHLEKGQTYLAADNLAKARVEFQNALQIDPKDPQARYQMGRVEERLGKPRQAAQLYQSTIDVSPDSVGARTGLARLYLFSGDPERALEIIKPGLAKHPDDAGLLTLRAAVRSRQKDVTGALEDAERAVALAPADEEAVAALAGIYRSQGEQAKAEALLTQSIQRIPGTVELRLVLAEFFEQNNRSADAEAQLIKLVELRPHEKAHRVRLALFYVQTNRFDTAEATLRQAVTDFPAEYSLKIALVDFLAAHRSRGQAEAELRTMIAAAPGDPELTFALGRFYAQGKDAKQAEAVYQGIIEAHKLDPLGLRARDQLAALRFQGHDLNAALDLVNEVLVKSPRDEEALVLRGNIALLNQDPRSAITDLRAVLRDQPTAVGVLRSLAHAHLANGEPGSAEETMRSAVEANPNDQALRLDLARLLAELGKPEQAQALTLELVRQAPDNIDALDVEYRVSSQMRDYITARAAADSIVALRPKLALGYFYQGMLAEARNHAEEALHLYRTAREMEQDTPEPLEAEIRLLVSQQRVSEALKSLDEIAVRDAKNSLALNLKGDVLLGSHRPAEAQEAFKQAIARTPQWWLPYRGLASAELSAKQDPAVAIATLRNGEAIVDRKDLLGEDLTELFERMGKPEEAIVESEQVVRGYPQSEVAANNLAMLLVTYRKDQASLDRAKELSKRFANSGNAAFLDTYGWVLYKHGESAASVPVLARAVEKIPDQVVVRYHLGMAQALAGKSTEARDNLTRVVNSGQQFAGLDEARATLDKIAKLPAIAVASPKS